MCVGGEYVCLCACVCVGCEWVCVVSRRVCMCMVKFSAEQAFDQHFNLCYTCT